MARYSFLTTWALEAPIEAVWEAIHDTERWPTWWRGVKVAEQLEGGAGGDGVGSVHRYVWRSRLPYDIEFRMRTTRLARPYLLEGDADGNLRGTGRWRLWSGPDGTTAVTYEWDVETTIRWMNAVAPLGRPVFHWSHDVVMRNGGRGLAERLGARLLLCD